MPGHITQRFRFGPLASRKGAARYLLPAAVNWTLFAYAFVLCLGIWGLAFQRIQSDYGATLLTEREHLRSVSGTLEAQVEAMLADGVGAALAAVNELEYRADGGAGGTQSSDTLVAHADRRSVCTIAVSGQFTAVRAGRPHLRTRQSGSAPGLAAAHVEPQVGRCLGGCAHARSRKPGRARDSGRAARDSRQAARHLGRGLDRFLPSGRGLPTT